MAKLFAVLAALFACAIPAYSQQCASHDQVISDAKTAIPNATHLVLNEPDTKRLITGMKREFMSQPDMEVDSAIVFADPTKPKFLVVTFSGVCAKQMFAIAPSQYDTIMRGANI